MAAINVKSLSLKELVSLEGKLQFAIIEARSRERSEIKKKLAALAATSGFSLAELFGSSKGAKKPVGIAKYANPEDKSSTWTGRGRKPTWLVIRLKKGAKLEDFAI
ncbi:H-NS family nucleoid-associated regulatory protein [Hyphomicrobium sp.]|jgi:DNA-binding protein H-NS|uniref:H-NS histone family protein n=1 Tax=Hyphomicrobium sp. TaxID=82 RepID=UPI0035630B50